MASTSAARSVARRKRVDSRSQKMAPKWLEGRSATLTVSGNSTAHSLSYPAVLSTSRTGTNLALSYSSRSMRATNSGHGVRVMSASNRVSGEPFGV